MGLLRFVGLNGIWNLVVGCVRINIAISIGLGSLGGGGNFLSREFVSFMI